VPEHRATLDALQQLPEIGADGPVGCVGIGLGSVEAESATRFFAWHLGRAVTSPA